MHCQVHMGHIYTQDIDSYPQVYPQINLTDNIILLILWRKMEESGEWSTFFRGDRKTPLFPNRDIPFSPIYHISKGLSSIHNMGKTSQYLIYISAQNGGK
jgi:hypothetical protein